MPSSERPGFFERLLKAGNLLMGREEREYNPAPFISAFGGLAGMPHPFKPFESLTYYGDNPWLYACISLVAQESSRVKLRLYRRKKNGEHDEIFEHQSLTTLNRPMPVKGGRSILTHMQLKQLLFKYICLNGEGFWLMDGRLPGKYGGAPTIVHPLMPAFVLEKLDADFQIESYLYRAAGKQIELEPLDVIHFKDPDPKNWYRGHSPMQSLRYSLDSHKKADELNYNRFNNEAVPSGILSSDQQIGEQERKRLRDEWSQIYGGTKNSHKTAVMPYGLHFEKTQESNADMQYAELKKLTKEEILANFRIPAEMLGQTESQTRANAEVSNYVFQRFTILPLIESFVDTLNNDYLPAFPKSDDLFFGFDEFIPENLDAKRQTTQTLSELGALTPNEARAGFGLEPLDMEQADVPYLPFNKVAMSTINPNPKIDEDIEADLEGDDADEEDELEEEGEGIEPEGADDTKRQIRATDTTDNDDDSEDEGDDSDELPKDTKDFFDTKKEAGILSALTVPFLIQAFTKGVDIANESTGGHTPTADVFSDNVRKAIVDKSLKMSADAINTTEDQLRQVLLQAQEDKVGVRALASRINDLYGQSMGYRSLRIARTELTGSINQGAHATFIDQGYEYKGWSTVMDGHERTPPKSEFDHGGANGEIVPIDEPFVRTGEEMMYPGDEGGSPGNTINCRCREQAASGPDSQESEDRKYALDQMFLRAHGSLEQRFVDSLKTEFERQRTAILRKLVPGGL